MVASKLRRIYFRHILRPLGRLKPTASSVGLTFAVGAAWGVSGTVGLQIAGIVFTWIVLSRHWQKPFHLPIALLLTGITNVVTIPPLYLIYYTLGQWMLGGRVPARLPNFAQMQEMGLVHFLFDSGVSAILASLLILLGSLPFALVAGVLGWYVGAAIGRFFEHRRKKRESLRPIAAE